MIANGQLTPTQDIFSEWDIRIADLQDAPTLTMFWEEKFKGYESWDECEVTLKSSALLSLIETAGINRSKEAEVTANRDVYQRYFTKYGARLEPGSSARVEQPYWGVHDRILEKGVICPIIENETTDF